jgi:hypothetical protein
LSHFLPGLSIPFFSFLLCGCGSNYTPIEGTVTYNKNPVAIARLSFINENGKGTICEVVHGKFDAPRVPRGEEVTVTVSTSVILAELEGFDREAAAALPTGLPFEPVGELHPLSVEVLGDGVERYRFLRHMRPLIVSVPARYERREDTPFTFKITGSEPKLELSLTD